ncbi:hypothetical protein NCCP2495_05620 [Dietzia sp. NCCP-2495]|uniref:hypothetical protein n=1 Tax=Dietzia sp. NCCP-2495 TaxID=2934675 RepID=UPI00223246AB|nr:hypothetical protein [Dietzia sp. NCCP-2495]GLB62684.1 hypothetical protein NCCP2495_05620 [Dietzia sp. NCCP-2495]
MVNKWTAEQLMHELSNPDQEKVALDEARIKANIERNEAQREADRWRRAHGIVEQERDQARDQWKKWEHEARERANRAEDAERERDDLRRQVDDLKERRRKHATEREAWTRNRRELESERDAAVARAEQAENARDTAATRAEQLEKALAGSRDAHQRSADAHMEWKARAEAAEARLADPYSQTNQDAAAWKRIADHPALRMDLLPEADHTYAGRVFERITWLAETAEAVTEMKPAPAVTREDVEGAIRAAYFQRRFGYTSGDIEVSTDAVCDLFGVSTGQGTDPVLEKARELAQAGGIDFDEQEPEGVEMLIGMARHVLGQEADQ